MKRLWIATSLLLTLIAAPRATHAAPSIVARPFPVTITDDTGFRTRLAHQPKRILSLDPADTETLFALGLENRLVGDGSKYAEGATGITRAFKYPSEWPSRLGRDYPVRSKQLTHIEGGYGSTLFDLETIEKLQPDVIFTLKSDIPTLTKMRSLGLKVVIIDPGNLHGVLKDMLLVGRATGTNKQAQTLANAMQQEEATVRARVARVHSRPRVYYELDATNPLEPYTAGPGTFVDDAIHLAGARNVADAVRTCDDPTCYPQLSLESLVQYNPQIIVLADAVFGTTPESVKSRSGWNAIQAVQSGKIYPMIPDLLSRPGPRIMIGLRAMAQLVHPGAFGK